MKLLELIGVKKFADADLEDVLKSMDPTHTEVGRGTFGVTLKHSSKPEVIKFWMKDSSYDDFINYVATHPYKHFPKLYSKPKKLSTFFLRPTDFPDNVNYVKMEALPNKISEDNDLWRVIRDIFLELRDNCNNKKDVEDFIKFYLSHPNDTYTAEYLDMLRKAVPDVPDFVRKMYEMLHYILRGSNSLDIHNENMMLRGNGELVIIDPLYNKGDQQKSDEIKTAMYHLKKEDPKALKGKTRTPRESSK